MNETSLLSDKLIIYVFLNLLYYKKYAFSEFNIKQCSFNKCFFVILVIFLFCLIKKTSSLKTIDQMLTKHYMFGNQRCKTYGTGTWIKRSCFRATGPHPLNIGGNWQELAFKYTTSCGRSLVLCTTHSSSYLQL